MILLADFCGVRRIRCFRTCNYMNIIKLGTVIVLRDSFPMTASDRDPISTRFFGTNGRLLIDLYLCFVIKTHPLCCAVVLRFLL